MPASAGGFSSKKTGHTLPSSGRGRLIYFLYKRSLLPNTLCSISNLAELKVKFGVNLQELGLLRKAYSVLSIPVSVKIGYFLVPFTEDVPVWKPKCASQVSSSGCVNPRFSLHECQQVKSIH
jgi:hypothetical protein